MVSSNPLVLVVVELMDCSCYNLDYSSYVVCYPSFALHSQHVSRGYLCPYFFFDLCQKATHFHSSFANLSHAFFRLFLCPFFSGQPGYLVIGILCILQSIVSRGWTLLKLVDLRGNGCGGSLLLFVKFSVVVVGECLV